MTGPSDWVPAGTDVNRPSAARVYDYLLGGAPVGLVFIPRWRPDPRDPVDEHPERVGAYAGVGRKD